jgi:hypothetical protein
MCCLCGGLLSFFPSVESSTEARQDLQIKAVRLKPIFRFQINCFWVNIRVLNVSTNLFYEKFGGHLNFKNSANRFKMALSIQKSKPSSIEQERSRICFHRS